MKNIDQVSGKKLKEKLEANKDQALMSKDLCNDYYRCADYSACG
ncbi:hypothetical protein ACT7DO_13000 [Bacillus pacificus]